MQLHAIAAPSSSLGLELPHFGGSSSPVPTSPHSLARMEAVRSPTQQLLSRENSDGQEAALHPSGVSNAFERALAAAEGGGSGSLPRQQQSILLDTLSSSTSGGGSGSNKGALQRR